MKILHVIDSMDPRMGGTCQGIRNLATELKAKDCKFEVVCLDNPNSDYLLREQLSIHALGKGRGPWDYHPALLPWLKENLHRFDAAVLNGIWQYHGFALYKAAHRPNMPPYFVFAHGMLDPWFQRAPERRLKAIRNWFFWKFILQKIIRNAEAIFFTCSEEMRLAGGTFYPYQPKREINVGFGIAQPPAYDKAMEKAFTQRCPAVGGNQYFLFLGRIHPKKGVDILIKAYAAIYSSPPTKHRPSLPRLVIAGPGLETPYGKQMQRLAADLCPANMIFWPGMLTGDAKWGALYQAEAFVLTSHQENFGIAIVEALACGKPVLISKQINIWREIAENKAGLVADDTLAGAKHLFQHWESLSSEDKAVMKNAATACYKECFGIAHAANNLLARMEELTMRSPKRGAQIEVTHL